ncbi:MAG TPA: DUF2231 domain-containing protein [Candidatus Angelobacter sp.]|nr:DUF2231 domain-containing protein [Candidatus Angelobacter sp.]
MGPFDPRSIIFARHAQHVVLIHFPIALLIVGVGFDLTGQWKKNASLAAAAYYNLLVAAFSAPLVVVSGLLAWYWQLEGAHLKGTLLLHLLLGSTSAVLIWLVWWIHHRARRAGGRLPGGRLPVELLAVACVALTGHLGGFLSGVNT